MTEFKIRTYNAIAAKGLAMLPDSHYAVGADVDAADAFLLRSQKLSPADIGASVRAIARAGAGVNNVPVEHCSDQGVVVFNTPGANANSVKELVIAAMLLAARDLVGGISFVRELGDAHDEAELNRLVEAEKKRFKGFELTGKSLGVVGLGAIGSLVARAALDLGMNVLGYDPAISVDAAWRLPSEVQRMENLPSLFSRADFVTLHVPLMAETEGMINAESLAQFKPGAVLLNFARQPIVDTGALRAALDSGHISSYVADFPVPEFASRANVRCTPHLGASTEEAEENCAVMAASQLRDFLEVGNIKNSVNFPTVQLEPSSPHRLAIINQNVAGSLGDITSVLAESQLNVVDMLNKSRDQVAYTLIDLADAPTDAVIDKLCAVASVIKVRKFAPRT